MAFREDDSRPNNVGILALDIYFPNNYVEQFQLEKLNGVGEGKYTIGLGQKQMGFCTDREDINSICLTVTKSVLEKYSISPKDIGFLMIGTETLIEKSKSVKTILMDLFAESGNTDIEGLQTTNACYGGTASLFLAINWIESTTWDGRYALVIAADIALYPRGPLLPLGGCAAIAMLLGPEAVIVFDRKIRSTYMANVYDFYKPDMNSEYPIVEGQFSIQCYNKALNKCYHLYLEKANKLNCGITLCNFDAILLHAPQCNLVQKSIARLFLFDYLQNQQQLHPEIDQNLEKYKNLKMKDEYTDRESERVLLSASKELFESKTDSSLMLCRSVGNAYTTSLYGCLISYLLSKPLERLVNNKLLLYSYGSGLAASMFSAHISPWSAQASLKKILHVLNDIPNRLKSRNEFSALQFEETLNLRQILHNTAPYKPIASTDNFEPGTFYLCSINDKHKRFYELKSKDD